MKYVYFNVIIRNSVRSENLEDNMENHTEYAPVLY